MKQLSLFFILLFSLTSYTQESTLIEKPKGFYYGVSISADYCYRTLKVKEEYEYADIILEFRNENEVPKTSFTAGANVGYNFSKRFELETGLHYSDKGYVLEVNDLTLSNLSDPRGRLYVDGKLVLYNRAEIINHYNYLDVPLRLVIKINGKKARIVAGVGMSANVLVNAKNTIVYKTGNNEQYRETSTDTNDYKPINISATASLGIEYSMSKKLAFRIEPTFQYGLLQIIDAPITAYLWSGGIRFACYMN